MGLYQKGKQWYIDFYVKGVRKRKKVGPNKKLAEHALMDVQVKLAKEEFLGVYELPKKTFADFGKEYLEYSRTNKAESTFKRRDSVTVAHLTKAFGAHYVYQLTPKMIEEYKKKRLASVAPATVNRELGCLKHMFTKAIEWKYVRESPAKPVKLLKVPPGRLRYLQPDEADRLVAACPDPIRPVVVAALNTGMRRGEILSLMWNQVDLARRTITLMQTKNNEMRVVPINDRLHQELSRLQTSRQSEYVFSSDGRQCRNLRKSFDRALARAGITDFRFHDLRHTVGSHLVMTGVDLRTVQQILGHKTIQMTQRYSHLSPEHVQEAMRKLDSVWSPYGHQGNFGKSQKLNKSLKNNTVSR